MKVKEYLQEIQVMDISIRQKTKQIEEMKRMYTYLRGAHIGVGVKASGVSEGFTKALDKLLDLELELTRKIEEFQLMKNERIERIQSLSKPEYMKVLFKRYVEYKSIERISYEMNYTYKYTSQLLTKALKAFEIQNATKLEKKKNKSVKMVS